MVKTGVAFGDYIFAEKPQKHRHFDYKPNSTRDFFLIFSLFLVILILFLKLFSLQIVEGNHFRSLSNSNRIRTIVVHAPRGAVFDRTGKPLVFNVPGFRKTSNGKITLISKEEAIALLAGGEKNLEFDSLRQYPYVDAFSHVLGYTGQISQEELKLDKFADYKSGDLIGKMGIEQYYESTLRGVDGRELVEVDSKGKTIRKLGQTDPIPGQNITLNLDLKLQNVAFDAMKNIEKGAIVVSTPKGEVLTLISKPSFNPNLFTLPVASESAQKNIEKVIFDTKGRPLLDRAIGGTYPPGSTFKLVVATAGLTDKIIDENFQIEDVGTINVGVFSFSNWYFTQYGKTDGIVNVVKGIKRSNDIFFYKLAEKVGVNKISEFAQKFGLGKTLGIDLAGEAEGLVPTTSWKEKTIHEPWYLGDTYHYGIGQGYLLTTPLQVNGWTQGIANGGQVFEPHLLKSSNPKSKSSKFLDEKTISLVKEGMIENCSPGGIAWPLFDFKIKNSKLKIDGRNFLEVPEATVSAQFSDYRKVTVACKTGTAQHGEETSIPHAWITLFAPAFDPQIVVTVLAEDSGEGSNVAAPIAKKILEEWFSR